MSEHNDHNVKAENKEEGVQNVKAEALLEEFSIVELEDRLEFLVRSDNRSR